MLERFKIQELVDKETFELLGEQAWKLLDIRLKLTLDTISRETGWTIIINTWSFKQPSKYGLFVDRGFRTQKSNTGAKEGAHYRGMAIDCDCYHKDGSRIKPDDVRLYIKKNINKLPYIMCLETDINWVHFDVMDEDDNSNKRKGVNSKTLLLYSPLTGSKVVNRNAL
jgi:hypothetical protein